MKFSPSHGCFYPEELDYPPAALPADLIEVREQDMAAAMARPPGHGLAVKHGRLVVVPPPAPDLAQRRAVALATLRELRDRHCDGGCTVPGLGRVDSDAQSRINISGAVIGAMLARQAGAPYAVQWKLADNSVVPLDAEQTIAMGQAVLAHVSACHAHAQEGVIAGAGVDQLAALDLEAGWPGGGG